MLKEKGATLPAFLNYNPVLNYLPCTLLEKHWWLIPSHFDIHVNKMKETKPSS